MRSMYQHHILAASLICYWDKRLEESSPFHILQNRPFLKENSGIEFLLDVRQCLRPAKCSKKKERELFNHISQTEVASR